MECGCSVGRGPCAQGNVKLVSTSVRLSRTILVNTAGFFCLPTARTHAECHTPHTPRRRAHAPRGTSPRPGARHTAVPAAARAIRKKTQKLRHCTSI
jgi:hypothetical protein